jgi:hypothetical protein
MHGSAGDGFYAKCGKCRKPLKAGDYHVSEDDYVFGHVCGECK